MTTGIYEKMLAAELLHLRRNCVKMTTAEVELLVKEILKHHKLVTGGSK